MAFDHRSFPAPQRVDAKVDTDAVDRMILERGGTVADLVAPDIEIAREALLRAAKTAFRYADAEIHLQVVRRRDSLEDLMTFLSDRTGL